VHEGRWLGAKGHHVVFAQASAGLDVGSPALAALKRAELVGRKLWIAD
jgi:hypothetical protein